jgi:hypothetical protein
MSALCYSLPMTSPMQWPPTDAPPIGKNTAEAFRPSTLPGGARAGIYHSGFPRMIFVVSFTVPGGVPAGFAIEPWYPYTPFDPAKALSNHPVADDAEPLTATLMRKVPVGEIQDAARIVIKRDNDAWLSLMDEHDIEPSEMMFDMQRISASFRKRPGRKGREDFEYAEIAALYVSKMGSGIEVAQVADELGFSTSAVRNFLWEARRRVLLTPAPPGRAGGSLTPKARALLAERVAET